MSTQGLCSVTSRRLSCGLGGCGSMASRNLSCRFGDCSSCCCTCSDTCSCLALTTKPSSIHVTVKNKKGNTSELLEQYTLSAFNIS